MLFKARLPLLLTGGLWLCFLARMAFYVSFIPLWEGYDEFSHFAFVQYLANMHSLPRLPDATVSREVAESLRLMPIPWTIRQWTSGWVSHDDFWRLAPETRLDRERKI